MRFLPMVLLAVAACRPTWDPDHDGVPRLASTVPVAVGPGWQVSRFRSAAGHSFTDNVETCRSMKHYFWPPGGPPGASHTPSWATIEVRAPAAGRISRITDEGGGGSQFYLESSENPAFVFRLFHVTPEPAVAVGVTVVAGELLGHNASDTTYTDVAVEVNRTFDTRLVSFFETLTDEGFAPLRAAGVSSPGAFRISRQARDANPLACDGEEFTQSTQPGDWVELR